MGTAGKIISPAGSMAIRAAGGTEVQAPNDRVYSREVRENLQAQIDLAPDLYRAEASEAYGQPAYTRLGLRTLEQAMLGGEGQQGLLDMYANSINPRLSEMEAASSSAQRQADLYDVEQYGGRATEALLGADPYKKQISDELSRQALSELQAGATLDPSLRREVQQSYRQAATARGMAYSPSSAAEESYFTGLQAEQLRRSRQQFAQSALSQRQQITGDPFMQILGRPGQAFGSAQGFGNQGLGVAQTGSRLFSPESQYGADVMAGNYSGQMAAGQASSMAKSARFGAITGMIGGIARGAGAAYGCHVAREVYGEENPKWVRFFVWKETQGPRWFKALYNEYSEQWAAFIRNKPRIKNLIRNWMDGKIKEA